MSKERLIELFHELDTIKYANEGEKFKLVSGIESNYKIIADPVLSCYEGALITGELGYQKLKEIEERENKEYALAGVITGGLMFAMNVMYRSGRSIIGIDPRLGKIHGKIQDKSYLFLEDVSTVGTNILKSKNILNENSGEVEYAITIVNREEGARENLAKEEIILEHILTKTDLGIKI